MKSTAALYTFTTLANRKNHDRVFKVSMNVKQTPFQVAFRNGNFEIVKLLLKKLKPFDTNELIVEKTPNSDLVYKRKLLSIAVQNYDIDIAKYWLENTNADVNIYSIKSNLFSSFF